MKTLPILSLATALTAVLVAGCGTETSGQSLPTLKLDPARISVVGLSSGAAMAQQVHFAYSDHLVGAGLIAGPPFGCAQGDLRIALSTCMKGEPEPPDVVKLAERARALADAGKIAPLSGLDGDRVLVLHGSNDQTVAAAVTRASYSIYTALQREVAQPPVQGMTLVLDAEREFAHTWPTLSRGGECATTQAPFISACQFDASGQLLATLYGEAPRMADEAGGTVTAFDQNLFRPDGEDAFLADEGFLYTPKQCLAGTRCGAVFAFHGCEQNADTLGQRFVEDTGLNRWADVYDLVVIYPQTRASFMPLNPKACWDWWGYSGADYDTRDGKQLMWLANLAAELGIPLVSNQR